MSEGLRASKATVKIDYERLRQQVTGVVQLQGVVLTAMRWLSHVTKGGERLVPDSLRYVFHLTDASWSHEDGRLEVRLDYRLAAFAKNEADTKETRLFRLDFQWTVVFAVPPGFHLPAAEVMADFAVANGQLSAFPYVRQHVQDMTTKGGWPALVLPTFRIPATRSVGLGMTRGASR